MNKMTPVEAFELLQRCALAGERCPKSNTASGFTSILTSALARAGQIRIDIYPHNWRVVTIVVGPHRGKATAPCPNRAWKPYLTIQQESANDQ